MVEYFWIGSKERKEEKYDPERQWKIFIKYWKNPILTFEHWPDELIRFYPEASIVDGTLN